MVSVKASRPCWTSVTGMSFLLVGFGGEQRFDAYDAAPPDLFELAEQGRNRSHGLHLTAGQLLATAAPLGDEPRSLEHGDVLLHRGEAHRVVLRQRRDRVLTGQPPAQDVAPGAVGERVEQGVGPVRVGIDHSYNIQPHSCMSSLVTRGPLVVGSRAHRPRSRTSLVPWGATTTPEASVWSRGAGAPAVRHGRRRRARLGPQQLAMLLLDGHLPQLASYGHASVPGSTGSSQAKPEGSWTWRMVSLQ